MLGGGAFGRLLGHENGALRIGNHALINETDPREFLAPPAMWGHSKNTLSMNQSSHQTLKHLDLRLPSLQNCEKYILFKQPNPCYFVKAAQTKYITKNQLPKNDLKSNPGLLTAGLWILFTSLHYLFSWSNQSYNVTNCIGEGKGR